MTVRAASVIATGVVDEMRSIQNSYPVATVAIGRSMVGALLMASQLKNGQALSLYFQGNGPLSRIFAEATFEGQVRAFSGNSQVEIPVEGENIKVGHAIGIGLLTVTHHLPTGDEPHRGTVIIRTGEIGDDLAYYLDQSHQIPSVVALGVHVNAYGKVEAAGGVLIELMPGHEEATIAKIEASVKKAPPISKMILEGATPTEMIQAYLGDLKIQELEHPYPLAYTCRCSYERALRSIMLLGLPEIDQMLAEEKPAEIGCEFCGRKYLIQRPDLETVRAELYKASLN
jgi:molecular chaperone Hsp33